MVGSKNIYLNALLRSVFLLVSVAFLESCKEQPSVTVYTSVDRNFSEPILEAFEAQTGIRVDALYDVEAAKTTGLVNRLTAEAGRPRADVFWNGELVQTQRLAAQGLFAAFRPTGAGPDQLGPDNMWTSFGGRARVLIVNTDLVDPSRMPTGLADFLSERWPATQLAVASPLFGTSLTHAAALYAAWGTDRAEQFYRDLQTQGVNVVDGNSVVRDMAVRGQILFGLTDTDDACGAVGRGAPVAVVIPDQGAGADGALVIPNTAALVAGGPNPDAGRALIDYLLSADVAQALAAAGWFHVDGDRVLAAENCELPRTLRPMEVAAPALVRSLERAQPELRQIIVR